MPDENQSGSGGGRQYLDHGGRDHPGPGSADFGGADFGGADFGGADFGGAGWSGLGSRGNRGQPWFGRKRFGYGYGPRTWQGFLVTAVGAALVIIVGTVTKGHSPLFIGVVVLVVAVHLAIIVIQRRR